MCHLTRDCNVTFPPRFIQDFLYVLVILPHSFKEVFFASLHFWPVVVWPWWPPSCCRSRFLTQFLKFLLLRRRRLRGLRRIFRFRLRLLRRICETRQNENTGAKEYRGD